jgi:hypothetical protein
MEGLKRQMKDKEDKDRKKEEWFPSLVTFIVRNLNSESDLRLSRGEVLIERRFECHGGSRADPDGAKLDALFVQ